MPSRRRRWLRSHTSPAGSPATAWKAGIIGATRPEIESTPRQMWRTAVTDVVSVDRREVPRLHLRWKLVVAEDRAFVHRLEQVVLGVEREVQRLHGDAGALSDRVHRRGAIPVAAEQLVGGVEHAPASRRRLLLSRSTLDWRHAGRVLVVITSDYH